MPKKNVQMHVQTQVQLHTVAEVADILSCSSMHVYRQIALGLLPAVDIATPGSRRAKMRIRSDDLTEYINRNTRSRKPAPGTGAAA